MACNEKRKSARHSYEKEEPKRLCEKHGLDYAIGRKRMKRDDHRSSSSDEEPKGKYLNTFHRTEQYAKDGVQRKQRCSGERHSHDHGRHSYGSRDHGHCHRRHTRAGRNHSVSKERERTLDEVETAMDRRKDGGRPSKSKRKYSDKSSREKNMVEKIIGKKQTGRGNEGTSLERKYPNLDRDDNESKDRGRDNDNHEYMKRNITDIHEDSQDLDRIRYDEFDNEDNRENKHLINFQKEVYASEVKNEKVLDQRKERVISKGNDDDLSTEQKAPGIINETEYEPHVLPEKSEGAKGKVFMTDECPFCERGTFRPRRTCLAYLSLLFCFCFAWYCFMKNTCCVIEVCNYCGASRKSLK